MDYQVLFNIAVALVGLLGGVCIRIIYDTLSSHAVRIQKIQIDLVGEYVKREEAARTTDAFFKKLDMIVQVAGETREDIAKIQATLEYIQNRKNCV